MMDYPSVVHAVIGTISIYLHMGNYRECCSLRGRVPTLTASMYALVLATAPPLLSAGGKKKTAAHEITHHAYGTFCTLKNYTANLL